MTKTHATGCSPRHAVVTRHSRGIATGRRYIDCRAFPSETNCSVATSADSDVELLEAVVQYAVSVYKHIDSPELRARLQTPFQDDTPAVAPSKTATT